MFLSRYIQQNNVSLGSISGTSVVLLLFFQMAVWYPLLSEAHEARAQQWQLEARSKAQWKALEQQLKWLDQQSALSKDWATFTVTQRKDNLPTQWQIEGRAPLSKWHTVFEQTQNHIALAVMSSYWKRENNGDWFGRHVFDIEAPQINRIYKNWLPTKRKMVPFVEKDWRVLSTMQANNAAFALLKYKNDVFQVQAGSWLPSADLTVSSVSLNQVTLMTKDGAAVTLPINKVGGNHD